ncbi:MAG: isoprenylcysteine carboxylmethyltransferase family protein [Desulfobacteraceae bacterium]|nr:isoprenylcysteine carboxylmethyltransferase family protein [Desulfobacteraceae bacterium]
MENKMIKHRIYDFFATRRIFISRLIGVCSLILLLFTQTRLQGSVWAGKLMENLGLLLIVLAVLGRIWASFYICGYKNRQVIDQGPYSMVRNPLYIFSFLGVMGIAVSSGNLLFTGLIITLFLFYYPMVIVNEERRLKEFLGEAFTSYAETTPRFIPKPSNYRQPETYPVNVATFSRSFLDGVWFFLGYIGIDLIKAGHEAGILPVFLNIG